jgi:branched-chain amino acid transport system permease protein
VTVQAVFGLTIPLFVIVMSVLGGRTHWLGPVIGATFIVLLQDRLVVAGLESWRLIIFGSILAFVVVAAPEGLQARFRARPLLALGAFAVLALGSFLVGVSDELLDAISIGAVGAAAVALWPGAPRRVRRPAPVAAPATAEPVVPVEPAAGTADLATAPTPIVECSELARYFGGVRALDGLTLTISEGELVGLVGPNGSGKTTLVNLLSRTFRPTSGRIRIVGEDIAGFAPHRVAHAGVARTYQIPRPFPSMTVRDNVAMAIMFGREPRPIAAARQAAQQHLDFVHLTRLAEAYPGEINLHERQLLEMARAIASSPRVLLLDEALAGLNPAEIDNAVEVVRRIHQSGITIVIVEHLLRVVNQLATRVVVLDRGRLLADGDPQTVMREPAVVTAYLGKHAHA